MVECTDQYIPMLVDTRIDLDVPAGIAAEGATPAGRAALYDEAKAEWAVDGAEPKRTQTCEAIVSAVPPQIGDEDRQALEACMASADCDGFVSCMAPQQRARLAAGK